MSQDIYAGFRRLVGAGLEDENPGLAVLPTPTPIGTQPSITSNEKYARLLQELSSGRLVSDMRKIARAYLVPRIGGFIAEALSTPNMYDMFRAVFMLRYGTAPEDICTKSGIDPGTCSQLLRNAYESVIRQVRESIRVNV